MANETTPNNDTGMAEHLQNLVLDSADVEEFLDELAGFSASSLSSPDHEVICGITLVRRKKAVTVASSNDRARAMDEVQYQFGDGPCLTAIREHASVHVPDLRTDQRWPEYTDAVAEHGIGSMLGVPIPLEGEAGAGLNLYSTQPHGFTEEAIGTAETYARQTSKALRLAIRIAHLNDARNNLSAAMQSRTVIDLAVGVIIAQNRCSQDEAFQILKNASNTRNMKLRDVAAAVVESASKNNAVSTHFED
jgi:GAF domain-containing protein